MVVDIVADGGGCPFLPAIRSFDLELVTASEVESSGDGDPRLYLFLFRDPGLDHAPAHDHVHALFLAQYRVYEGIHPRTATQHHVHHGFFYWPRAASNCLDGGLVSGDDSRLQEELRCVHRACSKSCFLPTMDTPPATGTLLLAVEAALIVVS